MDMTQVIDYLNERASKYGGDESDMLNLTPMELWDSPSEIMAYWEPRHLSHILPQADFEHLANDWSNIVAELGQSNMERGAEIMSDGDLAFNDLVNEQAATFIDAMHTDDAADHVETILELIS